jgi:hypothetical protein
MAHPAYLREKARALRVERRLSIDEIAERLALPKTTIYYWVADLPLQRRRRNNPHPATAALCRKWQALRQESYEAGRRTFAELANDPTFRDFVCLYIAEGSKRCRNLVAIGNSDPSVCALADGWMRRFACRPVTYWLQYHVDQDPAELRRFWGAILSIDPGAVSLQRKSNSGQLRGRTWRSRYGVLSIKANDTLFRARLQGWIDCLQQQWLDSPRTGA